MSEEKTTVILHARRQGKTEMARQSGALLIGIDHGRQEGDCTVLFFYDDHGMPVPFPITEAHKVSQREYQSMFLGEFPPIAAHLADLAAEYVRRTEEYDRTVCTGPVMRDGVMPGTPRELGLINKHAQAVRRELVGRAARIGYTAEQLNEAISAESNHA